MRKVEVIEQPLNVNSGRLKLTEDQARRRRHAIRAVKGSEGVYDVIKPVQFKIGETVEVENVDSVPMNRLKAESREPEKVAAPSKEPEKGIAATTEQTPKRGQPKKASAGA